MSISVSGFLSGCGPPDHLDLCYAACDNAARCSIIPVSNTAVIDCKTACNNNSNNLAAQDRQTAMSCQNAGEVQQQSLDCYNNTCNADLLACQARAVALCIPL